LLVVLGLIGLLSSLLLAVLGRAKSHALGVLCQNHLRQWGVATQLYLADQDDLLPPEGVPNPSGRATNSGWYIQLPKTIGLAPYHQMAWRTNPAASVGRTVWLCPANPRRSNGRNLFHYCLNQHVDGTSDAEMQVRLSSIPDPAATVWLFDSKNLPAVGYWNFVHTNLHRQGAQFLFLDGHTARFSHRDYWDQETNRGRTNHPHLRWIP
jgi:prepilin-type processing-associated H-X9-DG protein